MKVAIIGSGIAGLACAYELIRHGIKPVIFEKKSFIGSQLDYNCYWTGKIRRLNSDPITYLEKNYSIKLKPTIDVKTIQANSTFKSLSIKSNAGYLFRRGREEYSLDKQMEKVTGATCIFDTLIDIEKISNQFDYVFVATGNCKAAKQMDTWEKSYSCYTRLATIVGDFEPDEIILWFDRYFLKEFHCFIIPNVREQACFGLTVKDIGTYEIEYYWKKFLKSRKLDLRIIETRDIEYECGFATKRKVGNVFLIGSAAGYIDDFAGEGAFNSIEGGIIAARSVIDGVDYEKATACIFDDLKILHEIREDMNNSDYSYEDYLNYLAIPEIKLFMDANPLFKIRQLAPLAQFTQEGSH